MTAKPYWQVQSALSGLAWPALPLPGGAAALSLLFQLEQTQWLNAQRLLALQLRELDSVLRHAQATVPFYREHWAGCYDREKPLTRERFLELPLLTREELQQNFDALRSSDCPKAHGELCAAHSSGSTGMPVRVLKSNLNALFWNVITLRDHRWHRRDLGGKLATIRHGIATGRFANWGTATDGLVATGPSVVLGVRESTAAQLQWLLAERPDYLMTYPSIAAELAALTLDRAVSLAPLRELRTLGEALAPETRELCSRAWEVPVTDTYSAEEVGYLALQCPQRAHYHVQSESVLLEVLDRSGRQCAPGEVGRVVISDLHNYALPLIRYELGDYAEVGEPCACGRGLPVIRRILGRKRNMLVTAAGERFWPAFGSRSFTQIAPIRQCQLAQIDYATIEVRLVCADHLAAPQQEALRALIVSRLPPGFQVRFAYRAHIARGSGGKYEDFVCELGANASSA